MPNTFFSTTLGFLLGSAVTWYVVTGLNLDKPRKRKEIDFDTHESKSPSHIDFLTGIVAQLWDHVNPAGSAMIRDMLEPMLKEYFPSGPLASMKVKKVNLGDTPLLLDNVVVHKINREQGFVQFDMDVLWDGDVEILFNASVLGDFGISKLQFKGRMSFILKPLIDELPCLGAVSYSFINQPQLDLKFAGIASVADFSMVEGTVHQLINDSMASMVVLPYRMYSKMDVNCSLLDVYQAPHGMARITLQSGRGFVVETKSLGADDIPDVYANVQMGGTEVRTPTVKNSLEPVWNYVMDFIVFDYDQVVTLDAWDEDKGAMDADDDLGLCRVTIRELLMAPNNRTLEMPLLDANNDSETGAYITVKCDLLPMSTKSVEILDDTPKDQLSGLLAIIVTQAFKIPLPKEKACTFVKVTVGDQEFATGIVKDAPGYDSLNPLYDCVFHVPLNSSKPDITMKLIQGENTVLGTTTVPFKDLVQTPTIEGRLNVGKAQLECSIRLTTPETSPSVAAPKSSLRPTVTATAKTQSSADLVVTREVETPIRKIRLTAVKGTGFIVRKRMFQKDDVPDVYLKLAMGTIQWKTSVIRNNTMPEWNESKMLESSDKGDVIKIEAFDNNKGAMDKDDFYGDAAISIEDLLLSGGTSDVELEHKGEKLGLFITLRAELVK